MNKYLVESPHKPEDCLHILDEVTSIGHVTHYEWGCESGVHTGWVIVDADNEEEALMSVPSIIRHEARAVRLNKFTPEMIQQFHKEAL